MIRLGQKWQVWHVGAHVWAQVGAHVWAQVGAHVTQLAHCVGPHEGPHTVWQVNCPHIVNTQLSHVKPLTVGQTSPQ
jgi:hypothetical protein